MVNWPKDKPVTGDWRTSPQVAHLDNLSWPYKRFGRWVRNYGRTRGGHYWHLHDGVTFWLNTTCFVPGKAALAKRINLACGKSMPDTYSSVRSVGIGFMMKGGVHMKLCPDCAAILRKRLQESGEWWQLREYLRELAYIGFHTPAQTYTVEEKLIAQGEKPWYDM